MTNKTTNEIIHEWCEGVNCCHGGVISSEDSAVVWCQFCDRQFDSIDDWRDWTSPADYEHDLNAIHEVEKKVVETFGADAYLHALLERLPEIRCKAIVSLIEKEKNERC